MFVLASPRLLRWIQDGLDVALGDERGCEADYGGESYCDRGVSRRFRLDRRRSQLIIACQQWSVRSFSHRICPKTGRSRRFSTEVLPLVRSSHGKSRRNGLRQDCGSFMQRRLTAVADEKGARVWPVRDQRVCVFRGGTGLYRASESCFIAYHCSRPKLTSSQVARKLINAYSRKS